MYFYQYIFIFIPIRIGLCIVILKKTLIKLKKGIDTEDNILYNPEQDKGASASRKEITMLKLTVLCKVKSERQERSYHSYSPSYCDAFSRAQLQYSMIGYRS